MEQSNPISPSANSIIDILTLRYNTEIDPILSKLTSNDFTPTNIESSTEFIKISIKLKILGIGECKDKINIHADFVSKSAKSKIE